MASSSTADESPTSETPFPDWVDRWVIPFMGESVMWPILVAVVGHLATLLALLLLVGWRKPVPFGLFGVGLALLVTARLAWVELGFYRRPRHLTGFLVGSWILAVGIAVVGARLGVL